MNNLNILVTGVGGGSIGEQIIKTLRNGTLKYNLFSADSRSDTIAKSIGDSFFLLPKASDESYIPSLVECCKKNDIKIIIPGSEPELIVIASNIDFLQSQNIYSPINSIDLIRLCSDKFQFDNFLKQYNFSICESHLLGPNFDYDKLENYPYVLKPVSGSGSKNVFVIQNKFELESIVSYLGIDNIFFIQEYVGSATEEYTVGILATPSRNYVNHIILKRDISFGLSVKQVVENRTTKLSLGEKLVISSGISQGTFVESPLIDILVKKVVEILKPTSSINLQCRIFNGDVYIFEINPRFSGTSNLRALVGFNEPEYLIKEYLSLELPYLGKESWIGRTVLRGIREYEII